MIIKSVELINFRNHSEYKFVCQDNTSLILGRNGFGKTSILEAIYILTNGKSFRSTDHEILKIGQPFYRITLEYVDGEKIIATYDKEKKIFNYTEKKFKRFPKAAHYPVILFVPSDLNLISHSPSSRRQYFDHLFSELNEDYHIALLKYEKVLKQRNELLKNNNISHKDLFSWNIMLAKYGTYLSKIRNNNIEEINSNFTTIYRTIAENKDNIEIFYKSETKNEGVNNYLKILEKNFQKDSILGYTSFGIHRDDYVFNFNDKIAEGSASRGETRSIILALKFIEARLINQKLGKPPIILLDDVFSELDQKRRKCLIKNFKDNQIIITSTENINI